MAVKLWEAPTQPFKTTLDGRLASADTSMAVVATTGLKAPGILEISRQDGAGTDTPEKLEYISFTGVLSKSITGLIRGLGGTIARDHNSGSIVECFLSAKHWGDLIDTIAVDHDATGNILVTSHLQSFQVTGISGASGIRGDLVLVPFSGVSVYATSGASGYGTININGVTQEGGRNFGGMVSDTNTGGYKTGLQLIEHNETIRSFSLVLSAPASDASVTIDLFKNNTSIFGSLKPVIVRGGTYVSTASISSKILKSGDYIHLSFI